MVLAMAVTATVLSLLFLAAGLCHGVSGDEGINGAKLEVHKKDRDVEAMNVGKETVLSKEDEQEQIIGGSNSEGKGVSGSENDESANKDENVLPNNSSVDDATDLHDNTTESPK